MNDGYPLVPCFRELEFRGATNIDDITDAIEARLATPWSRGRDDERAPILQGEFRVFRRDSVPGLLLFLAALPGKIYVSNIVPTQQSELSSDEYNEALADFYRRFAAPAGEALGIDVRLGDDQIDLEQVLDAPTFRALAVFSRSANRSSGSSHPMDREKWYEFMVLLHRSQRDLYSGVLGEWLALDGWSESKALDLVIEFEFGMGLLQYAQPL